MAKNNEIHITHVFADGTTSDSLEGHGPDADLSLKLYKLMMRVNARKAAEQNKKKE